MFAFTASRYLEELRRLRPEILAAARKALQGAARDLDFLRLEEKTFAACAFSDDSVAVVGPMVRSPAGSLEDSARRFPTVVSLVSKLFMPPSGPDYAIDQGPVEVDWLAGMFMLFRSEAFRSLGGFDEAYFLYYEDVDICHRLRSIGKAVVFEPRAEVIHDARRESHLNPRLAIYHLASAARFLCKR